MPPGDGLWWLQPVSITAFLHIDSFETQSSEALCLLGRTRAVSILWSQARSNGLDGISDCKVDSVFANKESSSVLSWETCKEHVWQCEFTAISNIEVQNISSSSKLIYHQNDIFIISLSLQKKKDKLNGTEWRECWKVHNLTSRCLTSFPKLQ